MTNRVAIYARVSTSDKGQDVDMQLRELRAYAALRGWAIATEYVDEGISGTKVSRPQLDAMMSAAKLGAFDTVLVWKFDRFARSTKHLLSALETFQAHAVAFVSLTEGIDTSSAVGRFVLTVLGGVAELERSILIERTKAGMRNAAAKGVHCGRPRKAA